MTPLERDTILAAREMAATHAEGDRAECGPAMRYILERLDCLLYGDDLEEWAPVCTCGHPECGAC